MDSEIECVVLIQRGLQRDDGFCAFRSCGQLALDLGPRHGVGNGLLNLGLGVAGNGRPNLLRGHLRFNILRNQRLYFIRGHLFLDCCIDLCLDLRGGQLCLNGFLDLLLCGG